MRVVAHEGLDGLRHLEGDWNRLLASVPERAWYLTYEAHYAGLTRMESADARFVALALMEGGSVRAICPLIQRTRRVLGVKARVWQLPWNGNTLMADVLCPPGPVREVLLSTVRDHLRGDTGGASWLVVGRVRRDSAAWECAQALRPGTFVADPDGAVSIVDATLSPEDHDRRRSKKFRRDLRKAGNRLDRLEGVRFESVAGHEEALGAAFATFAELEAAGWKGDAVAGTLISESQALHGYYLDLLRTLPGSEINTLHAEGHCLAAQVCFQAGSDYAMAKIAYNEEYGRVSPGQLLMDHTIRRCCEMEGIRTVNLVSAQPWHDEWNPDVLRTWDVYLPLTTIGEAVLLRLLQARFRYGPVIKAWLQRLRRGDSPVRPGATGAAPDTDS